MKKYDSYTNSGIEWIGDIPIGWSKSKFKYLTTKNVQYGVNSSSENYNDDGIRFIRTTDIDDFGNLKQEGVFINQNEIDESQITDYLDFLISRSGTLGRTYLHKSDERMTYGGYLVRFNFGSLTTSKFLQYYCCSTNFWDWISLNTIISTIGNVNGQKYNNMDIPLPPLSEQQKIVSFLDNKTSLIDSLIEKTQRKIELLKEGIMSCMFYKSNTNYYQDYWFQNIPDGWKILKFREVFEDIVDKGHTDERLLSVHQIKGVIYRDEQEQSVMNPSGDISNYKLIKDGDFVISLRSSEGGFEFSQVRGLVSPVYTVLRPKFKIDTVLFKYLFKSENFIQEINRYITGIREGKTINYKDIRDIPIPIPDNFQESVVSKHLKILELFDLWEKRNNKLKEYRQSIISEVVTGKRKVV